MDMGLAGKVALVTGGARDVGREIGMALANEALHSLSIITVRKTKPTAW